MYFQEDTSWMARDDSPLVFRELKCLLKLTEANSRFTCVPDFMVFFAGSNIGVLCRQERRKQNSGNWIASDVPDTAESGLEARAPGPGPRGGRPCPSRPLPPSHRELALASALLVTHRWIEAHGCSISPLRSLCHGERPRLSSYPASSFRSASNRPTAPRIKCPLRAAAFSKYPSRSTIVHRGGIRAPLAVRPDHRFSEGDTSMPINPLLGPAKSRSIERRGVEIWRGVEGSAEGQRRRRNAWREKEAEDRGRRRTARLGAGRPKEEEEDGRVGRIDRKAGGRSRPLDKSPRIERAMTSTRREHFYGDYGRQNFPGIMAIVIG
ncbi:hypothetical protein KM043_006133 [Ampulex compressa]|nr:hypothetical protein KM043_006133 [Ampulex compressa]